MSSPGSAKAVRPILVTGAGSGIGFSVAERAAAAGYPVFAGARRPGDLDVLAGLPGVTPLRLDVTRPEEVAAAVQRVTETGGGLFGLVNNAGIGELGPLAAFADEDVQRIFEVNVFGPHRMTNAFLPMLRAASGRVVNIGSQGGMITSRYYGPYTMTKFALEAYNEALAEELEPHGVRVSIVQPGFVKTRIFETADAATRERFRNAPPPFEAESRAVLEALDAPSEFDPEAPESVGNRQGSPPETVADVVLEALAADPPRRRYLVGTRWEGDRVLRALFGRIVDANRSPSHGYDRETLIAFLDRALERRGHGDESEPW